MATPVVFNDRRMYRKTRVPLLRQDQDRLLDSDYRGKTVLMHAAGAGRSALFDAVFGAIRTTLSDSEVRQRGVYRAVVTALTHGQTSYHHPFAGKQ